MTSCEVMRLNYFCSPYLNGGRERERRENFLKFVCFIGKKIIYFFYTSQVFPSFLLCFHFNKIEMKMSLLFMFSFYIFSFPSFSLQSNIPYDWKVIKYTFNMLDSWQLKADFRDISKFCLIISCVFYFIFTK